MGNLANAAVVVRIVVTTCSFHMGYKIGIWSLFTIFNYALVGYMCTWGFLKFLANAAAALIVVTMCS